MPDHHSVAEAIRCLNRFNEKAELLSTFSFLKKAFAPGAGATLHYEPGRAWQEKRGADKESTAAFALVLRFFVQWKDGIHLEQIKDLYQEMPLPENDKSLVVEILKKYNAFLDSTGNPEFAINSEKITNRMVLETFLYGELAHLNKDKVETYKKWRSGPAALLLESQFEYAVGVVTQFISRLAEMNVEAIQVLEYLPTQESA